MLDILIASAQTTALEYQYTKDWNGERVLPALELEATSLAEMDAKMDATPYGKIWRELIPREGVAVPAKSLEEAPEKPVKANREALVKRFGKKAIATLEKNIAAKTSKHAK